MRNPNRGGSIYYNYKGYYSVVLLALVDADYKFLWIEAGGNGASSDAQIFNDSTLKAAIEDGSINFPPPEPLREGLQEDVPYFLIGDDAFALKTWMMKPNAGRNLVRAQRIFNYRLSRARRVVENAFGIMSARFRCLLTTLPQKPENVQKITMACCVLHNLLRMKAREQHQGMGDYSDPQGRIVPGTWRSEIQLDGNGGNTGNRVRDSNAAKQVRLYMQHYVNSVGSVNWQDRRL
jgi:hypothetical protein